MDDKAEIIYAFIDSQNLNLSIQNDVMNTASGELIYKGWKLNFKRFFVYLKDKYKVKKSFSIHWIGVWKRIIVQIP